MQKHHLVDGSVSEGTRSHSGYLHHRDLIEALLAELALPTVACHGGGRMFVGPAGVGKCYILQQIYRSVNKTNGRWLALKVDGARFNLRTLRDVSQAALDDLAEQQGDTAAYRDYFQGLLPNTQDDPWQLLLDYVNTQGKCLLLIFQGMHRFIDHAMEERKLSDQASTPVPQVSMAALWGLRQRLHESGWGTLIGASDESAWLRVSSYDGPFHGFCPKEYLPLLPAEAFLRTVQDWSQQRHSRLALLQIRHHPQRIEVLHDFIPGTLKHAKRCVSLLSNERFASTRQLIETFTADLQERFSADFERLPAAQKAISVALALSDDLLSTGELAERLEEKSNKLSAQLKRMTDSGLVTREGRQVFLADRLFSRWLRQREISNGGSRENPMDALQLAAGLYAASSPNIASIKAYSSVRTDSELGAVSVISPEQPFDVDLPELDTLIIAQIEKFHDLTAQFQQLLGDADTATQLQAALQKAMDSKNPQAGYDRALSVVRYLTTDDNLQLGDGGNLEQAGNPRGHTYGLDQASYWGRQSLQQALGCLESGDSTGCLLALQATLQSAPFDAHSWSTAARLLQQLADPRAEQYARYAAGIVSQSLWPFYQLGQLCSDIQDLTTNPEQHFAYQLGGLQTAFRAAVGSEASEADGLTAVDRALADCLEQPWPENHTVVVLQGMAAFLQQTTIDESGKAQLLALQLNDPLLNLLSVVLGVDEQTCTAALRDFFRALQHSEDPRQLLPVFLLLLCQCHRAGYLAEMLIRLNENTQLRLPWQHWPAYKAALAQLQVSEMTATDTGWLQALLPEHRRAAGMMLQLLSGDRQAWYPWFSRLVERMADKLLTRVEDSDRTRDLSDFSPMEICRCLLLSADALNSQGINIMAKQLFQLKTGLDGIVEGPPEFASELRVIENALISRQMVSMTDDYQYQLALAYSDEFPPPVVRIPFYEDICVYGSRAQLLVRLAEQNTASASVNMSELVQAFAYLDKVIACLRNDPAHQVELPQDYNYRAVAHGVAGDMQAMQADFDAALQHNEASHQALKGQARRDNEGFWRNNRFYSYQLWLRVLARQGQYEAFAAIDQRFQQAWEESSVYLEASELARQENSYPLALISRYRAQCYAGQFPDHRGQAMWGEQVVRPLMRVLEVFTEHQPITFLAAALRTDLLRYAPAMHPAYSSWAGGLYQDLQQLNAQSQDHWQAWAEAHDLQEHLDAVPFGEYLEGIRALSLQPLIPDHASDLLQRLSQKLGY